MRRVAIVGSGIAGLACAQGLSADAQVTLFEADSHFGGHTHTVDVTLEGVKHGVDTGFLVFNPRTYPRLVQLFKDLRVDTAPSDMSFSVQATDSAGRGLEWSGSSLNSVFAQRRNLLSPRFLGMLRDILRFNRLATRLAESGAAAEMAEPIGDFLQREGFNDRFRDGYFLPMIGCIWSCPTEQMLRFPVATMIRFCHNHGLIQVADRPQWYTVRGGARNYVERLLQGIPDARLNTPVRSVRRLRPGLADGGVVVATDQSSERFDDVVLACHSDQSLALLGDATSAEREVLGAIAYHPNRALLHLDDSVLPKRRLAWAAWNYARAVDSRSEQAGVCLHYLINRLQPLPWRQPVLVSLNPDPARSPDPAKVLGTYEYSHPVFNLDAIQAQQRLPEIQGAANVWFCGAWTRYGFHEDGLMSAQDLVARLRRHWQQSGEPVRYAA